MPMDRRYTVLIVPEGSDAPHKRFVVTRRRVRRMGVWAGVLAALVIGLPALLTGVWMGYGTAQLRTDNGQLQSRLAGLDRRVEFVESSLERVQSYDAKIRALTRADEGVRPYGIGPLQDLEVLALNRQDATLPDGSALMSTGIAGASNLALECRIDDLSAALDAEEVSLQEVRGYLVSRESLLHAYPTAWPADGWITSRYGFRESPILGAQTFHNGLDIAGPYGSPIRATADGVVISASYREAYGYAVELDHGFGFGTLYAHCSRLLVEEGQEVERGDVIARIGATGRATGPHLHYEVRRDGITVNPQNYLIGDVTPAR